MLAWPLSLMWYPHREPVMHDLIIWGKMGWKDRSTWDWDIPI